MFACILAVFPLVLLASASHLEARATCSNGDVQCCNSVQSYQQLVNEPGSPTVEAILAEVKATANTPIGVTCTPISVIGQGSNSCTQQTVCCKDNNFNGVVAVGCTPINVNA